MSDHGGLRKRGRQGTFIPRAVLRDRRLSYKARGILANLLDRPAGWDVRSEALAAESDGDGKLSVQTGLQELGGVGYYRLERRKGPDGRFHMGTAISDEPVAEWAADYAEYDGKAVPVVWVKDRYWVRHKDGTLTPDGFDEYDDDGSDPTPDDDGPGEAPDIDECLFPQVTPELGFPAPESPAPDGPAPEDPGSEKPAPGKPGAGKPRAIRRTDDEEPKRRGSRTEPASQSQYGGPGAKSAPGPQTRAQAGSSRAKNGDAKVPRTPQEQAIFEAADKIARDWWDVWKQRNVPIVGRPFPAFRKEIVERALAAGATPEQVIAALRACNAPFPPIGQFQRELANVVQGQASTPPAGGQRGRPSNAWVDPRTTQAERERVDSLWDGVSINGKRVT